MKIIYKKIKLIELLNNEKNLGFVPTMGCIHKGHLSLVKKSKKSTKKTIVSIFVNRPQFNKKADFNKYPKTIKKDIRLLRNLKVDYLYMPQERDIYPNGFTKNIEISSFAKKLCGKFRPGHFQAVVDVIDRFIKIIKPKKIFMGEKDFQQLKIVEEFIYKKYKNTFIVNCKTIREKNGMAISSRNVLLSLKEKNISGLIYRFLKKNKLKIIKNYYNNNFIKNYILKLGATKIDYVKVLKINKTFRSSVKKNNKRIFIAYYLRQVRLIDNF